MRKWSGVVLSVKGYRIDGEDDQAAGNRARSGNGVTGVCLPGIYRIWMICPGTNGITIPRLLTFRGCQR